METTMDKVVALCKRRGFIFQSSEIYGGLNGFWDYGPLGVELKRNVKEAWWRDMLTNHDEFSVPPGAPQAFSMAGLDCSIIMHPQIWKCSGHFDLFSDMMQTCRQCKKLFRSDHVWDMLKESAWVKSFAECCASNVDAEHCQFSTPDALNWARDRKRGQRLASGLALVRNPHSTISWLVEDLKNDPQLDLSLPRLLQYMATEQKDVTGLQVPCPECGGDLTEPRRFNLMFETFTGAIQTEENRAFLRPETAQGIFANFKNVVDTVRVRVPFGIVQVGKSFRNEITPRNFTFRSREFEQMELEFFCHPNESRAWYTYWRDRRYQWYLNLGLKRERLRLRDHDKDELSHYSVGTADIEYGFPFLDAGEFGELEGVAHRGDFDLRSHMEGKLARDAAGNLTVEPGPDGKPKYAGSGKDLSYFDDQARERFVPHVIEPSAGADRATLAFICEAYTEDQQPDEKGELQTRVLMKFHPRLAPIKAAVLPLVKKDGMPELGLELYRALKAAGIPSYFDQQGAIGKRYRRQDEIGTPWCLTIDGQSLADKTVTLRDRDTLEQSRVPVDRVVDEIAKKLRE